MSESRSLDLLPLSCNKWVQSQAQQDLSGLVDFLLVSLGLAVAMPGQDKGSSHESSHHCGLVAAQEYIARSERATCLFVHTDVKQQLLFQKGFALPVAEVSCAESGPKFPGISCAGRGNLLPHLPVLL